MTCGINPYQSLKKWKDEQILNFRSDAYALNEFHDRVMKTVFEIALDRMNIEKLLSWKFAWFATGSGGRKEQGFLSDQDHGLVYEAVDPEAATYFLKLGEEIAEGLEAVGYPYCEGKVMSSNPIWCRPLVEWKEQISDWMDEASWQTMRNLHIFYDSRALAGEKEYIGELKSLIHNRINNNPNLLSRLMETSMHMKNAVGPLGQLLPEEKGTHRGELDLKYTAFIPYVNAVRLLAIKEGIIETSTIARLEKLQDMKDYGGEMNRYKNNFATLLKWRLLTYKQTDTYDDTHFLQLKSLTKTERNELKRILKDRKKLHQFVIRTVEKGVV
jgi:CBS domain-containing protein